MEIAIIAIGYILSIFFNRFLNKILVKKYEDYKIVVRLWFLPVTTIFLLVMVAIEFSKSFGIWFVGDHWEK